MQMFTSFATAGTVLFTLLSVRRAHALPLSLPINDEILPSLFLWNATHLYNLRQQISTQQPIPRSTSVALQHLRHVTEADLARIKEFGMPSVTNKTIAAPGANADLHYFTSLVPYAFPCTQLPQNCLGYKRRSHNGTTCHPDGLPWKICDGILNYKMMFPDRKALETMIHYVIRLSLYGYLQQDHRASKAAAHLLKTWFLDHTTNMYPSLQFAQGIPGVTNGKHSGCMDLYFFGRGFTDAIALLAHTPASEQYLTQSDRRQLSQWFADMAIHMVENPTINPESKMKNNHGVYYDLTVISLALLAGDDNSSAIVHKISGDSDCWEKGNANWCLHGRFESQVDHEGGFQYELDRADPGHYVWYTLLANSCLATFASRIGNNAGFNGGGLIRAADWALKHALNSNRSRIAGEHIYAVHAYRMLAVNTGNERYEDIACEIQKALSKKPKSHFWAQDKIGMEVLELAIPPLGNRECSAWNTFLDQYPDDGLSKKPFSSTKQAPSGMSDRYHDPGLLRERSIGDPAAESRRYSTVPQQDANNMILADKGWLCLVIAVVLLALLPPVTSWPQVRRRLGQIGNKIFFLFQKTA